MAFRLADINIGSALVENWGRATAYFQRYLQAMNSQIATAINQIEEQQLEIQEALDLAQQAVDDLEEFNIVVADIFIGMGIAALGVTTVTPNGSGDVTIPHGYVSTEYPMPTMAASSLLPTGTTFFHPQMTSVDATNIYARLFDAAGAPITTGSYAIAYRAAAL